MQKTNCPNHNFILSYAHTRKISNNVNVLSLFDAAQGSVYENPKKYPPQKPNLHYTIVQIKFSLMNTSYQKNILRVVYIYHIKSIGIIYYDVLKKVCFSSTSFLVFLSVLLLSLLHQLCVIILMNTLAQ